MDIQRWLDETVLPKRLSIPPMESSGAPLHRSSIPTQLLEGRRRRRPSTSDSSLLAFPERSKTPAAASPSVIEKSAERGASSNASPNRSGSAISSQPYARKPRRKTRPERYGPAKDVKERGAHTHRHQNGESRGGRRRSRRKKVDKLGTGMFQSFHAKNVPTDRLTLKPREKLGLFSKGRASSPVKGRGLPDLVFSEMKFLQRQKDQPEVDPKPGPLKKKRKKDHASAKEVEISAYFNSVRPALAEEDVNIQAKEGPRQKQQQDIDRRELERSLAIDNAIPMAELTDKASYLGFGNRGPRHESGSYISWSESIRVPSPTPERPRIASPVDKGQLGSIYGGQDGGDTGGGELLHLGPGHPAVPRLMTDGSGERPQASSLAPANDRISRSHSLPQHTSSPRRVNLVDRAVKCRTLESIASPSSMPAFIPCCTDLQSQHRRFTCIPGADRPKRAAIDQKHPPRNDVIYHEPRKVKGKESDQQTLSSLGRILQECRTRFNEQQQTTEPYEPNYAEAVPAGASTQEGKTSYCRRHPTIRRISTVRFTGIEEAPSLRGYDFSGPSIYEQQQKREHFNQQIDAANAGLFYGPGIAEDEGLQVLDCAEHDLDGYPEGSSYGAERRGSPVDLVKTSAIGEDRSYTILGYDVAVVVGSGFWRPHKLY